MRKTILLACLLTASAWAESTLSLNLRANALIRGEKYAEAKALLVTADPKSPETHLLLGVAEAHLHETAAAVADFELAGPVPTRFRSVVSKTYYELASEEIKLQHYDKAVTLTNVALHTQVSVAALFVQSLAFIYLHRLEAASTDLVEARALAVTGKANRETMESIDTMLLTAYIGLERFEAAAALVRESRQLLGVDAKVDESLVVLYLAKMIELFKNGRRPAALALMEQAAQTVPASAAEFYTEAARSLGTASTPDWTAVRALADRSLALKPDDPWANYHAGIAAANGGNAAAAVPFLRKARVTADAKLRAQAEAALRQLGQP